MGKKALATAIILIAAGLFLLIYRDPQFGLIFKSSTSRPSTTPSFVGSFSALSGASTATASSSVTIAFSALDIIESIIGAGMVGVGLVLVGVGALTGWTKTRIEE